MSSAPPHPPPSRLSDGHWTVLAFGFWVVIMGALTPGNVANDLAVGLSPNWLGEGVRVTAAGLLDAAATPLLLMLSRRFPPSGDLRRRNLAIQGLSVAGLAPALVLVSCFLAAWAFAGKLAPTPAEVASQMFANTLLLMVCLSLLLAILQLAPRRAPPAWVERLTIGERGQLRIVELSEVEWIEAQGNYQALHGQGAAQLLRDTSKGLAAKLAPDRFVRIHRRIIVAVDRVSEVTPLANGDAVVRLKSGVELRQSRRYRHALRARLLSQP